MSEHQHEQYEQQLAFPAPTIVVGMGDLGLAVLERLGEDWMALSQSGVDASLRNLRLLHVRPAESSDGGREWRRLELGTTNLACFVGDGDQPSLALDLAILRTLGLIRYRGGSYQVAVPRDGGVVEPFREGVAGNGDPETESSSAESEPEIYRRRYFEWKSLSPDPIAAVERLRHLAEQIPELDLVISPILHRVRQGHSPRVLLACIGRFRAYADGRDPSPWRWVRDLLHGEGEQHEHGFSVPESADQALFASASDTAIGKPTPSRPVRRIPVLLGHDGGEHRRWVYRQRSNEGRLDGFTAPPLDGWEDWLRWRKGSSPAVDQGPAATPDQDRARDVAPVPLVIHVPQPFTPAAKDLVSELQPMKLLEVAWETSGWGTAEGHLTFYPVPASSFRLGMFDHDDRTWSKEQYREHFSPRLQKLAELVRQGLIRLWIDLQRERVEEGSPGQRQPRQRATADDGLRQSLEMLGELIVRDVVRDSRRRTKDAHDEGARPRVSSRQPSQLLSGLAMAPPQYGEVVAGLLAQRLAALGLDQPGSALGKPVRLMQTAKLEARPEEQPDAMPERKLGEAGELGTVTTAESRNELCRLLNEQVREFYRISYLTEYRTKPVRRAPRLTVFVVGDMGEPFVRSEYRTLLREVHAELLRAFTPIFESFREGFDHSLSVLPIIWMPHPADPYEGKDLAQRHCEEAVIIDAIHSVRRWVESVMPPSRRRVSQIFVNSRVTDTAVLDCHDAARQTRDFITLLSRNDISRDEWLRRTATGPHGEDFFSSFSCYEIDFPAEKAREYLANRLARDLLSRLRKPDRQSEGDRERKLEPEQETLDKPDKRKLLEGSVGEVEELTSRAAGQLENEVEDRLAVERRTTGRRIIKSFSQGFEEHLLTRISDEWGRITQHRGRMDGLVDELRVKTSELLSKAIKQVRVADDRLVEELSHFHGIRGVLRQLNEQASQQRDQVEDNELKRRACEQLCVQHRIPRTGSVGRLRREVVDAAERKPDEIPMRFGLVLIALLAPVLGAPLCQAVAYYYQLHQEPGLLELLLGPLAPLSGGLVLLLSAWLLLSRHMQRSLERVQEAIRQMARGVREIVDGGGSDPLRSGRPSLRSFFAARLDLTATLAIHGFNLRVLERREGDRNLARRLSRSLDIQTHQLRQKAEDLGMRPQMMGSAGDLDADDVATDDVRDLFAVRSGESPDRLVSPESLLSYYQRELVRDEDFQALLPDFVHRGGGFAEWRKTACLSDGEPLLGFCRRRFQKLVAEPIQEQGAFADEAARSLLCFVSQRYPNIGFGAKFIGSEGLDPDGVKVLADAALLLHPDLQGLFRNARNQPGAPAITRTMAIKARQVRPNSAYMLSLVQGIRAHSVRNLKRFESFHDRPQLPDDRTFPLSSDEDQREYGTVNHFTSERDVVEHLNRSITTDDQQPASETEQTDQEEQV